VRIFSSRRLKGSGNAIEAIAVACRPVVNKLLWRVVLSVSALTRMKNCSRRRDLKLVVCLRLPISPNVSRIGSVPRLLTVIVCLLPLYVRTLCGQENLMCAYK